LHHKGEVVTNIPVSTLTDDVLEEPSEERVPQRILDNKNKDAWVPQLSSAKETLEALLQQPTIASKKLFTETYDSQVRTITVVGPG
ncbi:phosphoribosylformylglycinamidine synthase II, partial [Lactobacillus salivarius]|nr:phosphoribosylformylglycinamidine synthase II [Ligilactobacillus salivarius]